MKYPEINLMGDGMRVKILTDNVEIIIYSKNGNLCIQHADLSAFEYQADKSIYTKVSKLLEILR